MKAPSLLFNMLFVSYFNYFYVDCMCFIFKVEFLRGMLFSFQCEFMNQQSLSTTAGRLSLKNPWRIRSNPCATDLSSLFSTPFLLCRLWIFHLFFKPTSDPGVSAFFLNRCFRLLSWVELLGPDTITVVFTRLFKVDECQLQTHEGVSLRFALFPSLPSSHVEELNLVLNYRELVFCLVS